MHPSEAPANIQGILWRGQGAIKARVWLRCHTKFVTGASATGEPTFGSTFAEYQWEITSALVREPSISLERPKYMTVEADEMRQTQCTIELFSENGRLAVTQTGAIIRRSDFEQATVYVYAEIGGVLTPWFEGRVSGMPREAKGITTLTVTGYDWECLRKPVKYENFGHVFNGNIDSSQQAVYAAQGFRTSAAHINVLSSHFCAEHGITYFDGGGRQAPNVKQTGGEGIALLQIDLKNGISLGTYTIKFRDSKNYTVTYPSGQTFAGIITSNLGYAFISGQYVLIGDIGIRPEFWDGEDGTDGEFTIKVGWNGSGNPATMAFNIVEKGLLDNWGSIPTALAKMDIPAWTAAIRRFESFTVHVDATNEDNAVFENRAGNSPLSVAALAQRILNHAGCSLCLNQYGEISVTIPYLDDKPAYPHDTQGTILGDGIEIQASDYLTNYMSVQYAWNGESYGAKAAPIDLRVNAASQIVEQTLSLPYFKAGTGRRMIQWAAETFSRRFLATQVKITYNVHAGVGLLAQTGDRITIESNVLPKLNSIAEIFKLDKTDGSKDEARMEAHLIQEHEGPRALVCTTEVGGAGLW